MTVDPYFLSAEWAAHAGITPLPMHPDEVRKLRREALFAAGERRKNGALQEVAASYVARILAPIDPDASEGELRELARRRAAWMLDTIAGLCEPVTLEWINETVLSLEARPLEITCGAGSVGDQLAGIVKRVTCPHWWTRNVRRAATKRREHRESCAGRISVRTAPYVSNDTAGRYVRQQKRNRQMLESTEIESADGEVLTLADASDSSTANPAHRKGELMTRIKGAEEWATARGMVGIFTTNTTPSRFHPTRFDGRRNDKHDPALTVRDGQSWLCKTWARARAALARRNLGVFGFRVAEPHHDGTPHWHMLLWSEAGDVDEVKDVLRAYWLSDSPNERGAQAHRFKVETIDPARGGAIAYVAKYVAKNIDDTGVTAHLDESEGQRVRIETKEGDKARRVLAWASAHRVRQFQAVGQPPVTVWRELRRVEASAAQSAGPAVVAAHEAVNRSGERKACWRAYMDAQGGAMTGRGAVLRIATELQTREGMYGQTEAAQPIGVYDVDRGDVALSKRKTWRPRGTWTEQQRAEAGASGFSARAQPAQPWTRVNNCTGPIDYDALDRAHNEAAKRINKKRNAEKFAQAREWLVREGLMKEGPGGSPEESPTPCPQSPSLSPLH